MFGLTKIQEATLRAAEALLQNATRIDHGPAVGQDEPHIEVRGTYRGVSASVGVRRKGQTSHVIARILLAGRTFDLPLGISPVAMTGHVNLTGNPEFDERYDANGAPKSVIRALVDPEAQRLVLTARPSSLEAKGDSIRIGLYSKQIDQQRLRTLLDLGAHLLVNIPRAIQAAGEGSYLQSGSFTNHPEVVEARRKHDRLVWAVFGCIGLVVLVVFLVLLAGFLLPLLSTLFG